MSDVRRETRGLLFDLDGTLLGLGPEACLYIGDSPFDMQAGNGAGCTTVAALWGMFPREVLEAEGPDLLFGSLAELADYLDAIARR